MKIALLSFEYPPETGYGGIGTYTWYQARALVKLGHQVDVLCGSGEPGPVRESEHDGVRVYRFRTSGLLMRGFQTLGRWRLWWSKNRLENALSMHRAFQELNASNRYDIVEMPECGAEGLLINNLNPVKSIVRLHSPAALIMPYYDVKKTDIRLCSLIERIALLRVNAFSACSQFMQDEAREKLHISKPICVIPNGIDLEMFDSEEQIDIRKKFAIPPRNLIILFSGRLENRKGIQLCKEIARSLLERFEISFLFAGQDLFGYMSRVLLPYLKSKTLRGSVHYAGRLDQQTLHSCLKQSDIFFLPSLWENCPYSCLEAMAAQRAIVSSDQGGMPELIHAGENGNGLLARSGDAEAYMLSLEQLIEDGGLRERLGSSARKTVEQRHRDTHTGLLSANFYRNFLNHGSTGDLLETKEIDKPAFKDSVET